MLPLSPQPRCVTAKEPKERKVNERMSIMPKIKRKENDVEIEAKRFKIYFQKKYQVISLTNDVITGLMFIAGSLLNLFGAPAIYGNVIYLLASIFLTIRPLLKIFRHTWISKTKK